MNKGDQVYRLGNNIETDDTTICLNQFIINNNQVRKFRILTLFKMTAAQQNYTTYLTAIKTS